MQCPRKKWSDGAKGWWATTASLENTQARQLTELYRALRLYVTCFQPSLKRQSKLREGEKVRYVSDPAKTPLQRLLLSGVLPAQKQQELIEVARALESKGLRVNLPQGTISREAMHC